MARIYVQPCQDFYSEHEHIIPTQNNPLRKGDCVIIKTPKGTRLKYIDRESPTRVYSGASLAFNKFHGGSKMLTSNLVSLSFYRPWDGRTPELNQMRKIKTS